jgi:methionine-S-sulfoxide reductase
MKHTIYLAGGCFWGIEAYFRQAKGVLSTTVGYANGTKAFPTYEEVCSGATDAAETVKIDYDDSMVSLNKLLEYYLRVIDPYTIDKQGNDEGRQYRTGIYYADLLDGITASSYLSSHLKEGYQVKVEKLDNFFPAESYHQNYLSKNPNGYCHINLNALKENEKK